ncbi:unknown protein [Seminavis robusta]|uniref:Uncharacterized protein n=1 Tax=Seminavis robusta TaxID=568900 RepID=A0A9N8EHI7_9STRA|nr:unknown protein [Seminavis robusta]|eukprot:Sro1142_g245890.1 n/a (145) ;mRNA; r:33421-33855
MVLADPDAVLTNEQRMEEVFKKSEVHNMGLAEREFRSFSANPELFPAYNLFVGEFDNPIAEADASIAAAQAAIQVCQEQKKIRVMIEEIDAVKKNIEKVLEGYAKSVEHIGGIYKQQASHDAVCQKMWEERDESVFDLSPQKRK